MFKISRLDHVGIRVTDLPRSLAFYEKFGFRLDPAEDDSQYHAAGLVHSSGMRIHLIYNATRVPADGNVLLDVAEKWPGYTHAAFVVESMDDLITALQHANIRITEGPMVLGHGRRKACFIRDPDLNVVEFNEILGIAPAES